MKRKIFVGVMIMILLFMNLYTVKAFSGELDPENYITLPSTIRIENKVGTGTINLSSSASGYTLSYQKVDITESQLNSMVAKNKEANEYIEENNKILKEKQENVTTLQKEYQTISNSDTATEEEINQAKSKYEEAYKEYEEFYNTVNARVQELKNEYYALLPDYTNTWKTTTNSTNNLELDFKDYTGTTHFVLWVKASNGVNTYYDAMPYSSTIKEDTSAPDADKDPEQKPEGDWTNFSNAKYELVKDGTSGAVLEVTGVTPKDESTYYIYITSNGDKPDTSNVSSEERMMLSYNKEKNKFIATDSNIAKKIELNQDLYVTILEHNNPKGTENIVSYGKKLTRFAEAKYKDAFHATFMTYDADQIVTTFTHASENDRKIEIKVGKITDKTILNKLKNNDSSGFSDLMKYAKSNNGIHDKVLNANSDNYAISYDTNTSNGSNNVIQLSGLEDEAYYYLYVKTDDENGKYISNEAVTLAQANVHDSNKWFMFFYGSSDFKWADFGEVKEDDSVAPGKLPQAGMNYVIIGAIAVVGALGIVAKMKYKKYNF